MRKWKRRLVGLLCVGLLVSTLPTQALAAEDTGGEDVTYNTGHMNVTVTADESRLDEDFTAPFAADGSFVIELDEPEPFFPYEVQFTCGGETWSEWFTTPEDTVSVGGHAFSLDVSGEAKSLDFQVGGTMVRAQPAAKTFVHDPYAAAEASLLPLKEHFYNLDLRGYLPNELWAVGVDDILKALTPQSGGDAATGDAGEVAVWAKWDHCDWGYAGGGFHVGEDDRVQRLLEGGTLNLVTGTKSSQEIRLELIVGTADQFDSDNQRYIITVQTTGENDIFQFTARTVDRKQEIPLYPQGSGGMLYVDRAVWNGGEAYLSIGLNSCYADLTATVYKGFYYDGEDFIPTDAERITDIIWDQGDMSTNGGYLADYGRHDDVSERPGVTVVLKRGGETVLDKAMYISMVGIGYTLRPYYKDVYWDKDGTRSPASFDGYVGDDLGSITAFLKKEVPQDATCYCNLAMTGPDGGIDSDLGLKYVKAAYAGAYQTEDAAKAAGAQDIKDQLFSDASQPGGGYGLKDGGGETEVTFTVVNALDEVQHFTVYTTRHYEDDEDYIRPAPRPNSEDTYFNVTGADGLRAYVMPYAHDSYYYNGFQTVFLLDSGNKPVTDAQIKPTFHKGYDVSVYAGQNATSGTLQSSGTSAVNFANGVPVQYSASAGNGTHLKNYWVTFLTQKTGGPALFVNAANDESHKDDDNKTPVREVYLTKEFGDHHDIFFANIGDAEMTGITVALEDAQNVKLDEYWTVNNDATAEKRKLAAFTTVVPKDDERNNVSYGELPNVAKLRLVPDGDGAISGKLTISAKDVDPVTIRLTGFSSDLKFTTETITDGVKYVPYNSVIQTNSMGASDAITFRVIDGSLPDGVVLQPNGTLYGMPTRTGVYTFTVEAAHTTVETMKITRGYTITIKDNTPQNVEASTDENYKLIDRVPDVVDGNSDQVFRSEGPFAQFYAFYLDGRELIRDTDYTAEEGSTRVTIRSQTLRNAGSGSHTLAAEFRTDRNDTATVKRAAQNYTLSTGTSGSGSTGGSTGSGSGGSGGSGGMSKPSKNPQPATPATPPAPVTPPEAGLAGRVFNDIRQTDWFYSDVDWAYQQGLMIGVTGDTFAPNGPISTATVITVLSRLGRVDLTGYDPAGDPAIPAGAWYGKAAAWAKQMGLLPDDFAAQPTISRAKLAVMLVKYLKLQGVDCTPPEQPVAFADAGKMTAEENAAFQILYGFGIFKGDGSGSMNPLGFTSRAHLAALLHRLSVFVENGRT